MWTSYVYDGLGRRRTESLLGSTNTWFRWQGMEESGEYASAGSWSIGASAPEHLVEEVIRQLQDWFACEVEERVLVEEDVHFHLPLE